MDQQTAPPKTSRSPPLNERPEKPAAMPSAEAATESPPSVDNRASPASAAAHPIQTFLPTRFPCRELMSGVITTLVWVRKLARADSVNKSPTLTRPCVAAFQKASSMATLTNDACLSPSGEISRPPEALLPTSCRIWDMAGKKQRAASHPLEEESIDALGGPGVAYNCLRTTLRVPYRKATRRRIARPRILFLSPSSDRST
mmetsp:Transcript_8109/g.19154  ORF Transcript_8109/g.19154 Transcript_8109/m.19154 type:complete len:201 (-) Transcript_8109:7-609(-)